jgi:hypothetical protein
VGYGIGARLPTIGPFRLDLAYGRAVQNCACTVGRHFVLNPMDEPPDPIMLRVAGQQCAAPCAGARGGGKPRQLTIEAPKGRC